MGEPVRDTTLGVADAYKALDSHGGGMVVRGGFVPLRGRAYVREVPARKSLIITRESDKERDWYRGTVLALGPCGFTPRVLRDDVWYGGVEVPWGFDVGDDVLFAPTLWLDKMRTFEFFGVRERVWVVGQVEVMAVIT